jgi:hypothetical protein
MTDPTLVDQLNDVTNQAQLREAEANVLDIVIRRADGDPEAAYLYSLFDEQTRAGIEAQLQDGGAIDNMRLELGSIQAEVAQLNGEAAQLRQLIAGQTDPNQTGDPIFQPEDPLHL